MKLLFLITALNPNVRTKVRDDYHGLTYLVETLDLIIKEHVDGSAADNQLTDHQVDLLGEILKVLFNITVRCETSVATEEEEEIQFRRLAVVLHDLLLCRTTIKEKQIELCSNTVNLLTNVPTACYSELVIPMHLEANEQSAAVITATTSRDITAACTFNTNYFEGSDVTALDVLLEFLKCRLENIQKLAVQQELLSPILTALVKCVRCNSLQRRYIRSQVLPPLRDVKQRPEVGTHLRNYLCKLLTTPATQVRDLTSEFLFVLCKENGTIGRILSNSNCFHSNDLMNNCVFFSFYGFFCCLIYDDLSTVGRMIKYTGYGNAAGLFANRGLLGGHNSSGYSADYSSDSEDSDTEEYKQMQHTINPVLGCYEPPRPNPFEGMSDEQKEYETMKLVNLMDQLNRQGIVQPCRIGLDGRPEPVEHIMELQEGIPQQQLDHKRKT